MIRRILSFIDFADLLVDIVWPGSRKKLTATFTPAIFMTPQGGCIHP